MSSEKLKVDAGCPTTDSYISARLSKCLNHEDSGSCIEVSGYDEFPNSYDSKDSDHASFVGRKSTVNVCTDTQLRQVIAIGVKTSYRIFIPQKNSVSPLGITPVLLKSLIRHCELSSRLEEFMTYFGPRHGETSLSPPPTFTHFESTDHRLVQQVYIYILRYPERHGRAETDPFSIRQCLVYHQQSMIEKPSFLLTTGTASTAFRWLSEQTIEQEIALWPLWRVHFALISVALSAWRPYISHISELLNIQSDLAVTADLDEESLEHATLDTRQFLKQLEDTLDEVALILNHTLKTSRAILRQCQMISRIQIRETALDVSPHGTVDGYHERFAHIEDTVIHYLEQVETLKHKVKSTSNLVSDILELNNSNTLKLLAIRAADEGIIMQELTKKATQDAAAVKVLTVLTLIYLPSTVVMNFFSTSFVNTTTEASGGSMLTVANNWWIAIAATVPLTIITLYIWWFYVQKELRGEWPVTWQKCARGAKDLRLQITNAKHRRQNRNLPNQYP